MAFKKGHFKLPNSYSFPKGNPTRFKKGHKLGMTGKHHSEKTKEKIRINHIGQFKGSKHPRWKGGKKFVNGYLYIYKPNHPLATKQSYVRKSRLVMEKYLGRYLEPKEVVHHINKLKDDNRIKNLKLFPNRNEHQRFHRLNL